MTGRRPQSRPGSGCAGALLALCCTLPGLASAEGARLVFNCTTDNGQATQFVIAPQHTDPGGKGPIEVTRDGARYDGLAASDHGPFQYGTQRDHFALLFNGPTDDGRLKATLHHAGPNGSTLTPLTCEADL